MGSKTSLLIWMMMVGVMICTSSQKKSRCNATGDRWQKLLEELPPTVNASVDLSSSTVFLATTFGTGFDATLSFISEIASIENAKDTVLKGDIFTASYGRPVLIRKRGISRETLTGRISVTKDIKAEHMQDVCLVELTHMLRWIYLHDGEYMAVAEKVLKDEIQIVVRGISREIKGRSKRVVGLHTHGNTKELWEMEKGKKFEVRMPVVIDDRLKEARARKTMMGKWLAVTRFLYSRSEEKTEICGICGSGSAEETKMVDIVSITVSKLNAYYADKFNALRNPPIKFRLSFSEKKSVFEDQFYKSQVTT